MKNLMPFSTYLGKYYPELLYSVSQEKYQRSFLDSLFEQRFEHQQNTVQMAVDPALKGLAITVLGNEIWISQDLYDCKSIELVNSLGTIQATNPKSLYSAENFGSVAYLVCQNQLTVKIKENIDEPLYVKYSSQYEHFYHSVVFFYVEDDADIEIVEEIESLGALNAVTNYVISPTAELSLTTFYKNRLSASSIVYRNVVTQEQASFTHCMMGNGSSGVLDETKIHPYRDSKNNFFGVVDGCNGRFHTIVYVEPIDHNYRISVDYRNIVTKDSLVSFYPVIVGQEPLNGGATISVTDLEIEQVPLPEVKSEKETFVKDILDQFILKRMVGVERFYENKSKFMVKP